jgi:hypothetical protein
MLTCENSVADDVSGQIRRVAIQVASCLLHGDNIEKKSAYEQLVLSFPAGVHLCVVTDDTIATLVREWLSCLELSCTFSIVAVPDGQVGSTRTWMRDAFVRGTRNGTTGYLKFLASKAGNDQADWLAAADGTPVVCVPDVLLDGGDSLVGVDFRLVGHAAVKQTSDIAGHLCDYETALRRIEALDSRPLFVVGYRPEDIRNKSSAAASGNTVASVDAASRLRSDALNQSWGHIDLVVSLTGRRQQGKDVLLVAETVPSDNPSKDETRESDRLWALAKYLGECGFHVIRNPAPYALPSGNTLWYNNTILQTDPDLVWLPQFAQPGGRFADSDAANRKIWCDLGFKVVPVAGWMAVEASGGSIRCATSILDRRLRVNPPDQP